MNMIFNNTLKYFTQTPRTLFLLDGGGAALTTFFLFFVLRPYSHYFGMPTSILTSLAVIGLTLCAFSSTCFLLLKRNWTPFLRIMSCANLIYCAFTIGAITIYFNNLTTLGWTYFLVEITLIVILVYIELRIATEVKKR